MPIISEIWHGTNLFLQRIDSNIFEDLSYDDAQNDSEDADTTDCCSVTNFTACFETTNCSSTKEVLDIEIESYLESSVDLVGLQVWRGALFLADYIIMHHVSFENKNVLELAAGTGLTSIVAVLMNSKNMTEGNGSLICTDINRGPILPLIQRNFERNSITLKKSWDATDQTLKVKVAEIDFFKEETYCDSTAKHETKNTKDKYCLHNTDHRLCENDLRNIDVIFAADVIYDGKITQAFFKCLYRLSSQALSNTKNDHETCKRQKTLEIYLSIEKRCRVTALKDETLYEKDSSEEKSKEEGLIKNNTSSSDVFAPNYDIFVDKLNTFIHSFNNKHFLCKVEEISPSLVNQYFLSYERVEELVLFKLTITCKELL